MCVRGFVKELGGRETGMGEESFELSRCTCRGVSSRQGGCVCV